MADEGVEHGRLAGPLHGTKPDRVRSGAGAGGTGERGFWGGGTYDVAERDGVEEGGGAARGGVVGGVVVGEERGGLAHGLGELDELDDGVHGRRRHGRRDLEAGRGDLGGEVGSCCCEEIGGGLLQTVGIRRASVVGGWEWEREWDLTRPRGGEGESLRTCSCTPAFQVTGPPTSEVRCGGVWDVLFVRARRSGLVADLAREWSSALRGNGLGYV